MTLQATPSPLPTLRDVHAFIDALDDVALLSTLKSKIASKLPIDVPTRLKPSKPWGLPVLADLTIAQVCLFDNRDEPKTKASYGMAIEWWTGDPVDIDLKRAAGKLNVKLYTSDEFAKLLKANRSKDKSWIADMQAFLDDAQSEDRSCLFGPIFSTAPGKGSGYVPGQLAMADFDTGLGGMLRIFNTQADEMLEVSRWDVSLHTGDPLKGNAKLVSRIAFQDFRPGWATDDQHR